MTDAITDLLPCPCCSGEPKSNFVTGMVSLWSIWCSTCGLKVEIGCKPFDEESRKKARREAERRWNTRAMSSKAPTQELVEALHGCEAIESGPNGRGGMRVVAHFTKPGHELRLFGVLNAALSNTASQSKAQQKPVVPAHWNGVGKYGSAFSFEPGLLGVNIGGYGDGDGSGYFAFKDDDLEYEQDDGPLYRTVNVANSELLAIRDHLNELFPPEATLSNTAEEEVSRG